MNNTLGIGISRASLKQSIAAQCSWVEATNMATLPPIVNPAKNTENVADAQIEAGIRRLCGMIAGYIAKTSDENEDIYYLELNLPYFPLVKSDRLYEWIEAFIISHAMTGLYEPQRQAAHVTSLYAKKHELAAVAIKQLLASTQ